MKNTKLIKLVAGIMAATFSLSLLTTKVEAKILKIKILKMKLNKLLIIKI